MLKVWHIPYGGDQLIFSIVKHFIDKCIAIQMHRYLICSIDTCIETLCIVNASQYCSIVPSLKQVDINTSKCS